jgi:scyllo-inositol 2-dehydrogenase (NADP+)
MAIRTALIGYGIGGSVFHEPFLAVDPSYEIAAVVTSSPQRRAKAQQRYRVIPTVDELWSRADEFDLAIITSPTAMHTEHALAALDAGLHVVVDKPIAITAADARRIVEHAHTCGKSLSTFQSRRYDAEHQTARELISSGVLGDIVRLELNFLRDVGGLRDNWRDSTATNDGGGVTFDLGSHMFDAAQYLLGPATSITGTTRWLRGGDADDDLEAVLTHQSGAVSQIRCSWVAEQTLPWLHLVGTKASYTVNDTDVQEPKLKAGQRPTAANGFGRVAKTDWGRLTTPDGTWTPTPTVDGDYGAFYRGLARHLEHGEPVPVDPHDAVHTLELIESFLSTQGSAHQKGRLNV